MIIPVNIDLGVSSSKQVYELSTEEYISEIPVSASTSVNVNKDYNQLFNKPSINGVTLQGSMTLEQLGISGTEYDTEESWNAQRDLIAERGVIYVYSNHSTITTGGESINIPAIKIGDGTSYLIDMPFLGAETSQRLLAHIADTTVHVTPAKQDFWDNKVAAYINSTVAEETLVLSSTDYMKEGIIYNG